MIEKLFNEPNIFYQVADEEDQIPELPVTICKDASGIICLGQNGSSEIVLNKKSIKELCDFLKKY